MSSSNINRVALRGHILYYYRRGRSAEDTISLIYQEYRRDVLPLSICKMWFKKFESGNYNDYWTRNGTRSEVQVLYDEDPSQSQQKIADRLGISQKTVSRYLKVLIENGQIERVPTRTQVEELYNKDPSKSQREIADTLGLSASTVSYYLIRAGNRQIERQSRNYRSEVEELYNADRYQTYQTIAERLGIPVSTVTYHMIAIRKNEQIERQSRNYRSEVGALYNAGPSGTQQIVNRLEMPGSTVLYHVKAIEEETGRQVSRTRSQLETLPDTTLHQTPPPVLLKNFSNSEAAAWCHVKEVEENQEKETQDDEEYVDVWTISDTDEDDNTLGWART
ncbi:uncharacterized protein LOC105287830 [Ooceraea biroi]|uniref:uncharacterized protein LOC105287830 n=1 Tax=Ooceraea biroi TaxID=2015173 RepID=UPI000F097AF0|nr:uncharacterized protein LOC105287830 [Ooceraea biroi]